MSVTKRHDMTLAVKVALKPNLLISLGPFNSHTCNSVLTVPKCTGTFEARRRSSTWPMATQNQSTETAALSIDGCAKNGSIDSAARSIDGAGWSIAQVCTIDRSVPSFNRAVLLTAHYKWILY